jgi:hypothetical protein
MKSPRPERIRRAAIAVATLLWLLHGTVCCIAGGGRVLCGEMRSHRMPRNADFMDCGRTFSEPGRSAMPCCQVVSQARVAVALPAASASPAFLPVALSWVDPEALPAFRPWGIRFTARRAHPPRIHLANSILRL